MLVLKKTDGTPRIVAYLDSLVRPGRRPPKQKYERNTKPASVPYGDHVLRRRDSTIVYETRTCASAATSLLHRTLVA